MYRGGTKCTCTPQSVPNPRCVVAFAIICAKRYRHDVQSNCACTVTSLITTLGGASKKCPYLRSVVIPEVSLYVLQLEGTLLWAWKFCRYSRIVLISAVVISEVDCTVILCMYMYQPATIKSTCAIIMGYVLLLQCRDSASHASTGLHVLTTESDLL